MQSFLSFFFFLYFLCPFFFSFFLLLFCHHLDRSREKERNNRKQKADRITPLPQNEVEKIKERESADSSSFFAGPRSIIVIRWMDVLRHSALPRSSHASFSYPQKVVYFILFYFIIWFSFFFSPFTHDIVIPNRHLSHTRHVTISYACSIVSIQFLSTAPNRSPPTLTLVYQYRHPLPRRCGRQPTAKYQDSKRAVKISTCNASI